MPCSLCLDLFTSPTSNVPLKAVPRCSMTHGLTWPGPPCASKKTVQAKDPIYFPKDIYESFSKVHMCLYRKGALTTAFINKNASLVYCDFWGGSREQCWPNSSKILENKWMRQDIQLRLLLTILQSRSFQHGQRYPKEHILSVLGDIGL